MKRSELPELPGLLSRWNERGGGPVVFLPPYGAPAALYRAAGLYPLPADIRPLPASVPEWEGPVLPPSPVEGAIDGGVGTGALLDRVEAIIEALGALDRIPIGDGAIDRELSGERRVAGRLAALADPLTLLPASERLPPVAFLLLTRSAPLDIVSSATLVREAPLSESPFPPSPFRDGIDWDGRGDPRLFAARAWEKRLLSLRSCASAVPVDRIT